MRQPLCPWTLGSKGSLKPDISVTPPVGVMLALLIIMMLIAPMVRQALPGANNTGEKRDTEGQTVVAIDSRSQLYVKVNSAMADGLVPRIPRALEDKTERLVYVKGGRSANEPGMLGP